MQEESFLVRLGEVRHAGNGTVQLRFSRNIGTETENVLSPCIALSKCSRNCVCVSISAVPIELLVLFVIYMYYMFVYMWILSNTKHSVRHNKNDNDTHTRLVWTTHTRARTHSTC